MIQAILNRFKLQEVENIHNLDDVKTTLLHAEIIRKKPFLKKLYTDFYHFFEKAVPSMDRKFCVELGSGGGFIKELLPSILTSDILDLPHLDMQFSALKMPFEEKTVDALFMIDVLHHIDDSGLFFEELDRCLKAGGKVVMVEPANTAWSRFAYQNFHHEDFDPKRGWKLEGKGPLSSANGAIPWIIFYRDRRKFEKLFPKLKIRKLSLHTPFRYLISGGVSMRQLFPSFTYPLIKGIEWILSPFNFFLAMFITIELEKTG
jgi:SAM-dependent methyltransferase